MLSYCLMSNHFHLLLEVPPVQEGGLDEKELLQRLSAIHSQAIVAAVAMELSASRSTGDDARAAGIHERYIYRIHSLSESTKTFLQRFTR